MLILAGEWTANEKRQTWNEKRQTWNEKRQTWNEYPNFWFVILSAAKDQHNQRLMQILRTSFSGWQIKKGWQIKLREL